MQTLLIKCIRRSNHANQQNYWPILPAELRVRTSTRYGHLFVGVCKIRRPVQREEIRVMRLHRHYGGGVPRWTLAIIRHTKRSRTRTAPSYSWLFATCPLTLKGESGSIAIRGHARSNLSVDIWNEKRQVASCLMINRGELLLTWLEKRKNIDGSDCTNIAYLLFVKFQFYVQHIAVYCFFILQRWYLYLLHKSLSLRNKSLHSNTFASHFVFSIFCSIIVWILNTSLTDYFMRKLAT